MRLNIYRVCDICNTIYTESTALTQFHIHASLPRVGRKKLWTERIQLPMAHGTTARIDALLEKGEVRLDLIRSAIERELKRRERNSRLSGPSGHQDDGSQAD